VTGVPDRAASPGQQFTEPERDRARKAAAYGLPSSRRTGANPAHRPGDEQLVGGIELGQAVITDQAADASRGRELEHGGRGDSLRARGGRRSSQHAIGDQEDVGRLRLRDEAAVIEHQRVIRPRGGGLDPGENRRQQVVVMNLGIQAVGQRRPPHARGDQRDARGVVDRRLVVG
jgi:hypothetical protein